MKRALRLIVFYSIFCWPILASAQQKVTGNVISESDKTPLIGATITLEGTNASVTTNQSGGFSITAAKGQSLAISYTGFTTKQVTVSGNNLGKIELLPSSGGLEDVVVVGYGTQKKVNVTGAVEVVKGKELVNRPTPTLSQALQGKVSGVTFSPGTYGFEPGAALSLQVRGQGSPLILVDGVTTSNINGINPNDIESVSLLKDAAASAIYGARAPYGVLLITTKSGSSSGKLSMEYSGNYTTMKPLNMPHEVDSYTTALAMNEAAANSGIAPIYTNETVDRILAYQKDPLHTPETIPNPSSPALWADGVLGNANYDWFNEFYGKGQRQQHNFSVNDGNKAVNFYLSGGLQDDGGLLQIGDDKYKRYNTTAKFEASPTTWMKISSNTRYYYTTRTTPAYDNQGNYDLLFHQVARTAPSQPMKSPNGVYRVQSKIPWTRDAGTNNDRYNDFVQRFATEITPLKGWTINADYTFDLNWHAYTSNNYTVYDDDVAGNPVVSGSTANANIAKSQDLTFYKSYNVYSTYKFKVGDKSNFSILVGYQQERSDYEYLSGSKTGLITSSVPTINTSTGTTNAGDNVSAYATEGIFSRVNYNYDNRYLFEFNSRYDGTYKFADGKKWGFFPSASAGWNVSSEKFWERIKPVLNNFKIRASYGSLGNQLTATAYQDIPLLSVNANLPWIVNGTRPSYVTPAGLINPEVTWETSNTKNLGLDMSLLHNRLKFTGDIYQRLTTNQLGPQSAVPATIGVTTLPQANNRETRTNGWELSLNWNDAIGKDFHYSVAAQVSNFKTVVTKYNNPTQILTTSYSGQTVGEIWGYVTKGLIADQATATQINTAKSQAGISGQVWLPGDIGYVDLNNDKVINVGNNTVLNPGDQKIIGNSTPQYQFGLTLRADWKGFDISMFWQGVGKRDLAVGYGGATNFMWGFTTNVQSSIFPQHLDYYRDADGTTYTGLGKNLDAYYAKPYLNTAMNAKNQVLQTRYLLNGAYARLKNLQLGYSLPDNILRKTRLGGIYLYASGENLATISNLLGQFDPETANVGSRGDGKSFFPSTAFTFGVNLKF